MRTKKPAEAPAECPYCQDELKDDSTTMYRCGTWMRNSRKFDRTDECRLNQAEGQLEELLVAVESLFACIQNDDFFSNFSYYVKKSERLKELSQRIRLERSEE